ncbi:hypothetical protein U0070_014822, partial [Myodes glareolus]
KEGKQWEDLATVKESKTKKKIGLKAEPCHNQRHAEKRQVEPAIPVHEKRRMVERFSASVPVYLMDREGAKDHVTHPELKASFCLPILGVKKNISSPLYTVFGAITKSRVIDVDVSEFGLVTQKV